MPHTRHRHSSRPSLIRLRCLTPGCRGELFYVPRRWSPDPLQPLRLARRQLLDPTRWAVSGVGTDGSITAYDEDDVVDDFWTAEVEAWWSRCRSCGCLHYLPAPKTRAVVAAAAARGEPFVRLAPLFVVGGSTVPGSNERSRRAGRSW
jgi:hypothetical protein